MSTSTVARTGRPADGVPTPKPPRGWLVEHRPFVVALVLGAGIRVLVLAAFTPAFIHSDGPTYLDFLDTLAPNPERPDGYGLLVLLPLSLLTDDVRAVAITQHLMGLLTAVLMYVLLRRWRVRRWPATLATLPVLFDALQLVLEHTVLSDTLFDLVLVSAFVVLGWRRRPQARLAFAAGLLLGLAVTVRLVGEPLVLAGVLYLLLVGAGWRQRVATALALTVGFALPVGAYVTWYHHQRGVYALSESVGKATYIRTTTFSDCATLSVPGYQRPLCPREPLGQRLDPTDYAFHDPRTLPRVNPPPGTTLDQAMLDYATAVIRQQPADYARIVLRDVALNFDVTRVNRFEYDTAYKWRFGSYVDRAPTPWTGPAYTEHGGDQLRAHQPWAGALGVYSWLGYVPGPLLLACLALGTLGLLGVGRARRSGLRARCLLLTGTGAGLLLVPALTADFSWRYQLPALVLLPAGAAVAYTALRVGRPTGPVTASGGSSTRTR